MKHYEAAANSLSTLAQLDHVRMSPGERRMARAYLLQAELLAEVLLGVQAKLRAGLDFVRRGKVSAVTPELN